MQNLQQQMKAENKQAQKSSKVEEIKLGKVNKDFAQLKLLYLQLRWSGLSRYTSHHDWL